MDALSVAGALKGAPTVGEVSRLLSAFGSPHGLGTHVLSPVPTPERPVEDGWFLVQNWPTEWHERYVAENLAAVDPIPLAATLISRPITMTAIREGAAGFLPEPGAERLWALAAEMGRSHGLLVPVFGPQGYRGIVCFAGSGPDPDEETSAAFHLVALYAHDRVRALSANEHQAATDLTEREIAVLRCAATGLGDAETAERLSITVRTVRFHFTNIREKLGAVSREQCIAIATHRGML